MSIEGKYVKNGFTLVELSLSIAFIAVLSIAVALIVSNAIATYHRGVILNQVNTTGMELVDDIRGAIQGSQARSVAADCVNVYGGVSETEVKRCEDDSGGLFVLTTRSAQVNRKGAETVGTVPVFGAFCTGSYSYIWNSGYLYGNDYEVVGANKATLTYRNSEGQTRTWGEDIRLLKVKDEERAVCKSEHEGTYNRNTQIRNDFNISSGNYSNVEEEPVDILKGDHNLALYDLAADLTEESDSINGAFYSVSFILATMQGGININAKGDYCVTPGDVANTAVESFDYCAINKFNFAAQANGG